MCNGQRVSYDVDTDAGDAHGLEMLGCAPINRLIGGPLDNVLRMISKSVGRVSCRGNLGLVFKPRIRGTRLRQLLCRLRRELA